MKKKIKISSLKVQSFVIEHPVNMETVHGGKHYTTAQTVNLSEVFYCSVKTPYGCVTGEYCVVPGPDTVTADN